MEQLTPNLTLAFDAEFIDIYGVQCNLCVIGVKEYDVEVLRLSWILFLFIIFEVPLKNYKVIEE